MALHERALNSYFQFFGSNFKASYPLANIIIHAISLAIVVACLALQRPYIRWARSTRNSPAIYGLAVFFILITFILEIAVLARSEESARERYSFYIIYVFETATALASEVLVFYIFTSYLAEASHKTIWRVVISLLTLLAVADVALEIVVVYYQINQGTRTISALAYYSYVEAAVDLSFAVLAFTGGLVLTGYLIAKPKQFSKAFRGPTLSALSLFIIFFALQIGTDATLSYSYSHPVYYATAAAVYNNNSIRYINVSAIIRNIVWAIMLALILVAAALGVRSVEPVKRSGPGMETRVDV